MFQNNFIKFKSFKMLSLKNVDAQSTNVQLTVFKKLKITIVIDALLS